LLRRVRSSNLHATAPAFSSLVGLVPLSLEL